MIKSTDNKAGIFADLISEDFQNIRRSFINRSKAVGYIFDEDLFMDAYVNCQVKLGDKPMTKIECIKYFWVAYHNKLKIPKQKLQTVELNTTLEQTYMNKNEEYHAFIEDKCDEIERVVRKKYDSEIVDAWLLHMYEGKSYRELYAMGYVFNFKNIFKQIHQYLRRKYRC